MNILLANLGNRNITYNNIPYQELETSNVQGSSYLDFYQWTKNILDNYEEEKKNLDINIINPLVKYPNKPDKIIFFYSDQSQLATRTNQDTIFEARIIKLILLDKYGFKEEQIELLPIEVKVIDTGKLMLAYRFFFNKIKKTNFTKITICDAGGTAQQKMALKIIAEYMLEPEQYVIKYAEKNTIVSDVCINEYRNIIDKEQAIQLIRQGELVAASQILKYDWQANKPSLAQVLHMHVLYRYYGNQKSAIQELTKIKNLAQYQLLIDYSNNIAYSLNNELSEYFSIDWIKLTEKFYKVLFLLEIKSYSLAILTLSQFYEELLIISVDKLSEEYNFGKFSKRKKLTEEQRTNLKSFIDLNYPQLVENHKADIGNLSTQILIGKKLFPKSLQKICNFLSVHVDYTDNTKPSQTINTIRNKIAHEGLFINEKQFLKEYGYISSLIINIKNELKLNKENLFKELFYTLETNLRE